MWLLKIMKFTGLHNYMLGDYVKYSQVSVQQVVNKLTTNEKLRAVMAYCFGDYGTIPSQTPFVMHAILMNHFIRKGGLINILMIFFFSKHFSYKLKFEIFWYLNLFQS